MLKSDWFLCVKNASLKQITEEIHSSYKDIWYVDLHCMLAPATYILHTPGYNRSKNLNFSLQPQQATNIGHATGPPWQTCSRMCAFSLWASASCLESSSLCWRSCRRIASISATRCSNTAMPLFSSGENRRPRLEVEITYLLCDSWKQHYYWRHVSHPPSHRPLNCFSCAAMCRLSSDFSSSALRRSFCTLHTHKDGRP